jgi:hypothetical protein
MSTLLTLGWLALITWGVPNLAKDEDLKIGLKLVFVSMSIGILIGMFIL